MNLEETLKRAWRHPAGQGIVVLLIAAMGALLRFVAIGRWPPGLYHDEAYNGLDALHVLQLLQSAPWPGNLTKLPLFFEANNGREPLFIYLLAPAVDLVGRSPGALRIVSAILGSLTVPAIYWLGRELFDHAVGMVAALLVTTTVWTLNLSRVALRAVAMVPLLALALALLWRGLRRRHPGTLALAGLVYGLSFYTYLAARMSVVALFFFIAYMLVWHRQQVWLREWTLFALVAIVVVAPLAVYVGTHGDITLRRMGQVSLLNPDIHGGNLVVALARNLWRTLGAFFWRGDFIPRHNVPLRPVFAPLVSLAFLVGVLLSLRRIRQPAYALSLIWLAVMLVPTVLAEDAPHFLRGSGVLPLLFYFPALGLVSLARRPILGRPWLAPSAVVAVLSLSATQDLLAYTEHVKSEAAYYQFESGAVELAAEINNFLGTGWNGEGMHAPALAPHEDRRAYVASRLWRDWPSLRYLCPETPNMVPLGEGQIPQVPSTGNVLLALWPFEGNGPALSLLPPDSLIRVREGARERGDLESESRLLYVTYQAQPSSDLAAQEQFALWQEGIRLLRVRLDSLPGDRLAITLYWQATRPIGADYTVFCHVIQDGKQIGQSDGPPALGYYPTSRWRPGDMVEDIHAASLSAPAGAGRPCVRVGLYRWETMERLQIESGGDPAERTYLELCD